MVGGRHRPPRLARLRLPPAPRFQPDAPAPAPRYHTVDRDANPAGRASPHQRHTAALERPWRARTVVRHAGDLARLDATVAGRTSAPQEHGRDEPVPA